MPPPDTNSYGVDDDGTFMRFNPNETVSRNVSAKEAVPALIAEELNGIASIVVALNAPVSTWTWHGARVSPESIAQVEAAAYLQIVGPPGSGTDAKLQELHQALGDNPTVIMIGIQVFGADEAVKIWGPQAVADAQQNSTKSAGEPSPSRVIQNSQGQGVGPVALGGSLPTGGGTNNSTPHAMGGPSSTDTHRQGTASSPQSDPKTGGDPLLLATGQLFLQVTDLSVRGRGIHFSFTRTYLHQTIYRGPMGYSWDHCYNLWLREAQELQPDGTFVNVVYRSNGGLREDRFVQVTTATDGGGGPLSTFSDAIFRGPPGYFDELSKAGGIYRLRMVNGTIITYNDHLKVESIADQSGNALTFAYHDRLLVRVTDPVGKIFDFINDSCGRVATVIDRIGGRRVAFAYDDIGNLLEVDVFADAETAVSTDYVYLGPNAGVGLEHNLVEVIGADGFASLLVQYGTELHPWTYNRVVEQRSQDGIYRYEYGPAELDVDPGLDYGINRPIRTTTVIYPNGHVVEHVFNAQGNVVRRHEELRELIFGSDGLLENLVARYWYNREGLLIREERPDGATVSYLYAGDVYEELNGPGSSQEAEGEQRLSFGDLLRRAETARTGSGEIRQLVTTWQYLAGGSRVTQQRGPYYADPLGIELPGQVTPTIKYVYDAHKRLKRIEYDAVQTANGVMQSLPSSEFSYDTHGNLIEVRVGALLTRFKYFTDVFRSGFVSERIEDAEEIARTSIYEMDNLGRMTGVRDGYGAEAHWDFNGFDLVVRATAPLVNGTLPMTEVKYDRARRVQQVTETIVQADGTPHPESPLVTHYRYDQNGRLVEQTSGPAGNPQQRRQKIVYTPWGQPQRQIDAVGGVKELEYDARNLLKRERVAVGTPWQRDRHIRYNRSGEVITVIDGLGHATHFERDGFGRISAVIDRDGNRLESEYDAQGRTILSRLVASKVPGSPPMVWSQSSRNYDGAGRLMRTVDLLFHPENSSVPPRELITSYFYDEFSRLKAIHDPGGTVFRYGYDGLGRVIEASDGDGNTIRSEYDDAARKLVVISEERVSGSASSDAQFFRDTIIYDQLGLPVQRSDSLGNISFNTYDSRGLEETVTFPGDRTILKRYDLFGQLREETVGTGATMLTTMSEYDLVGRQTALISPRGDRYEWTYDVRGRLSTATSPLGTHTRTYDAESRLIEEVMPSGLRFHRTYSPEGWLLTTQIDESGYIAPAALSTYAPVGIGAIEYTYNPAGRLVRVDKENASLHFEYDSLHRVLRESSAGIDIQYGWDDSGRRASLTYPSGREVRYNYTPGGYLTKIEQFQKGESYPGNSALPDARTLANMNRVGPRLQLLDLPGFFQVDFAYDAARRLVGMDYTHGGTIIQRLRTLNGGSGQRLLDTRAERLRVFEYDDVGRLQQVEDHPPVPIDVLPLAPASSVLGLGSGAIQTDIDTLANGTATLAGSAQQVFDYSFDLSGNRITTKTTTLSDSTAVNYVPTAGDRYAMIDGEDTVYDADGNLLRDGQRTFRYDTLGRLREVTEGGTRTTISYDPIGRVNAHHSGGIDRFFRWAGIALLEITDSNDGQPTVQLVPGGHPFTPVQVAANGHEFAPLLDDMGSIIAWFRGDEELVGVCTYDPFGRILTQSGILPAPLGFTGYLRAPQSDLFLTFARAYDARHGRFLQRDPLGFVDGANLYAYARNAPGTWVDLLGFKSTELDMGTVVWEATKTIAMGAAIVTGGTALVTAGVFSAPFVATVGGLAMVGAGMNAFFNRSEEAFKAGQTDPAGAAGLAALGDIVGLTNIVEGYTGKDAVTDRTLGSEERSQRLGSGIGSVGTLILGPKASGLGKRVGTSLNPKAVVGGVVEGSGSHIIKQQGKPVVQLPENDASFEGIIDVQAFNNDPAIIARLNRANEFDIGGYRDLTAQGRYGRVGDFLDSDEALQNVFIRERRGVGRHDALIRDNPAIALRPQMHNRIQNLRSKDLPGMSARDVLRYHTNQMRSSVPDFVVNTLERESLQYIERSGLE